MENLEGKKTDYFEVRVEEGKIVLILAKVISAKISLESIRRKIKKKALTEEVIEKAIRWSRENF
jgi:hypothetical protein